MPEQPSVLNLGGGTPAIEIDHGSGIHVWDTSGRQYIDCTSQSWALYLGHSHPDMVATLTRQARRLLHAHQGFGTAERERFARELLALVPGNERLDRYDNVTFTATSALAIETALKLSVLSRPGRTKVGRLSGGFHGTTLGTAQLSWPGGPEVSTGRRTLEPFAALGVSAITLTFPSKDEPLVDQVDRLRREISTASDNLVAVVVEPIQGSGGQRQVPGWWLAELRKLTRECGCSLIFDEIQTYIRSGKFYSDVELYEPDFICLGKGVAGGLACGVVLAGPKEVRFPPGGTYDLHTFSTSPLAHALGMKLLEVVERDNLIANTNERGIQMKREILSLQDRYPSIAEIRQIGLHVGVVIDQSRAGISAQSLRERAIEVGVLFGLGGYDRSVLKIKPPLIVSEQDVHEIVDRLEDVLQSCAK